MILFSVIVPVYNVEKYLDECLQSIIRQTFKKFEIILVDDGSTDNSSKICDEYAEKYAFIKVIHKKNGGLSSSRNTGIFHASGRYLLFIDSDDKLYDETVFEKIKSNIHDEDVILLGFDKWYSDNTTKKIVNDINLKKENIYDDISLLIKTGNFVSSACNKCLKKDFIIGKQLFFVEGILSEDVEWSIRLLLSARTLSNINGSYYLYRQTREGSISTVFSKKHGYDLTSSIEKCFEYINKSDLNHENKEIILNYLSYQYMVLMAYYIEISDNSLKKRIKQLSFLLNYDSIKKVSIIKIMKNILGYNITAILMNKFVRNRK